MGQFSEVKKLVLCALFIALALILPSFFHLFTTQAGSVFLPMHIPVLLCGFILGSRYGLLCGIITPLLSSLISGGMPPMYPVAIAMAVELGLYGFVSGFLYPKQNVIVSLLGAMIAGRIGYGLLMSCLLAIKGGAFGLSAYISSAFITALPGILLQLFLIPLVVVVLSKANLMRVK